MVPGPSDASSAGSGTRVLYQGLLRSPASWARVGRGFLGAFVRLGMEVAAISPRGFLHDPCFPLPAGLQEVSAAEVEKGAPPEIGLGFLHPPLIGRMLGKRKVCLFVWESDLVPPDWVEELRRGADLVVVPSNFTRAALLSSGFPESGVEVVPYGYDEEHLLAAVKRREGQPLREDRPFTFLSVLSPHPRKGLFELFRAYSEAFTARDRVLLRVKTTYDPQSMQRRFPFEIASWRELIEASGLGRAEAPPLKLEVATVDDADIFDFYRDADAYVAPTWGESFGLAQLEAAAAGLPVITTGWGGHLDFLPPGPDLVPYNLMEAGAALYKEVPGAHAAVPQIEALVERMRWHQSHPEQSRGLGSGVREQVASLTWTQAAKQLMKVL